jgi:uncharacterized protein (DUF885 family)
MTRVESLKLFNDKAWDDTDFAVKELTRYQSIPGQATTYMIGQIGIKRARQYATDQLGSKFDIKEFHYQCCPRVPRLLRIYLTIFIGTLSA